MPRLEPVTIAVRFDILSTIWVLRLRAWMGSSSLIASEEVQLPLFGRAEGHTQHET
jgi:hypothetical protein